VIESHHTLVRRRLARFHGKEIDTAVLDGFFVTFDWPARAIRCACAIRNGVRTLGLEIRAGVHSGEVQISGDRVSGLAMHVGARVTGLAQPGEVLVSQEVKHLVAGSKLTFSALVHMT
jgi:class 3 adenylate cyclase